MGLIVSLSGGCSRGEPQQRSAFLSLVPLADVTIAVVIAHVQFVLKDLRLNLTVTHSKL